jgi:hypothetical protein
LACEYLYSTAAVEIIQEKAKFAGEDVAADHFPRKNHGHALAVHRQRSGNLGADESAAEDAEPLALLAQAVQAAIVFDGPEVDGRIVVDAQSPGCAAGGQQQLLEGVGDALLISDALFVRLKGFGRSPQVEIHAPRLRAAPDAGQGFALPQSLRQRWPIIGGSISALIRPTDAFGSTSRIPRTAASAVMPPPTIRYL